MGQEWTNWSGSLCFRPDKIEHPACEEDVQEIVRRAAEQGKTVRPLGSGHSSTPILETDDVLVSLDRMDGVLSTDADKLEAVVGPGEQIETAGPILRDAGLDYPNLGDVSTQRIIGAISTGTHGTGKDLQILSTILAGGRIVTGTGDVREFGEDDMDFLRAARVNLGALGIFTQVRLKLMPTYTLQRREYCGATRDCLPHLDELVDGNRNFDFYWYPRDDHMRLRLLNPPNGGILEVPYAKLVEDKVGRAYQIIPKHSHIPFRFDEMEYALPAEAGRECLLEVRKRVLEKWRRNVGWRVLYRTIAPDDSYLSPAYDRQTVTISLHQNASLPFWDYFKAIEPIFLDHGGRPHWAKKNTCRAGDLRPRYPEWDRFMEIREKMDPEGVFLSPYLQDLLGVEKHQHAE